MTSFKFTVPDSEEFLKVVENANFVSDFKKNRFLKFAQAWYEDEPDFSLVHNRKHYINEWIDRFKRGVEYLDSDYTRLGYLLSKVDGEEAGKRIWALQLAKYNNTVDYDKFLPEIEEKIKKAKAFLAGKMKGVHTSTPRKRVTPAKKHSPLPSQKNCPIKVDFRKML